MKVDIKTAIKLQLHLVSGNNTGGTRKIWCAPSQAIGHRQFSFGGYKGAISCPKQVKTISIQYAQKR